MSTVILSALLVVVLLGQYMQTKERTADHKRRVARAAREDALYDRLEKLLNEAERHR